MGDRDMLDLIDINDLTGEARDMAEIIGIEAYRKLIAVYGGTYTYIAKGDYAIAIARNRLIVDEYDGENAAELAAKYGLTDRSVRDIVRAKADQLKKKPLDGQMFLY